ncbi:MAG: molybdopterin-guanine dinucleotide biosynthesis protein B [Oscillospiraceae bacterium]|nr:molybdopterin-guanine dinucleotide biosynthesis protein B [Oscillospiraceae bacterium]
MDNGRPALSVGILAGGKSTRMGKNKAFLRIENELVIERTAREFGSFSEVLVSAASKGEYEYLGLPVVYDENRDIGPIEGLRQAIRAAKEEFIFVCAADMPFLKKETAEYIAQFICSDYDCYVLTDEEHIHPLCAIYSRRALPVIEKLISQGNYRLREIFAFLPTKYISLTLSCIDKKSIRNINTKEDYLEAVRPVVFSVSGFSDSGKTWLISKLINEFITDGYSTAVLKHDGHDMFSDLPDSDTDVFTRSGAYCSAVFSDTRYAMTVRERMTAEDFIHMMKCREEPPDVIIIEGLKSAPYPKVVTSDGTYGGTVICTVGCTPLCAPAYDRDDVKGIYLCIKSFFGLER